MTWWGWCILGCALLVAELTAPTGFILLFIGVAALLTGFLEFAGIVFSSPLQWLIFGGLSVALLFLFRKRLVSRSSGRSAPPYKEFVGGKVKLSGPIAPGKEGKGEFQGSSWTVKNCGSTPHHGGEECLITGISGLTLEIGGQTNTLEEAQ